MNWRIGTRGSRLALAQTELVRSRLAAAYPEDTFEIVTIRTKGDAVTDRPIAAIGDSALFTREIENVLAENRIDLAVHSMKDLPAELPAGLVLAKAWTREDPRDVLVCRGAVRSLADLPRGATVATGSVRRNLLLRRLRPDLRIVDIRGNVDTRLKKLFGEVATDVPLDAIVLAAAGLKRLGRADVITEYLETERMIPAPNQGQLAIELRADDAARRERLDALGSDADEAVAVAERSFLREMGVDCHMPIGAFARVTATTGVTLDVAFARSERDRAVFARASGPTPRTAALAAAEAIRRQIAGEVVLVGAGPGDPALITVAGLKAIRAADVLVYDRLVAPELIREARSGCELIYVGKQSGHHTLPQDEINSLLVRKATTRGKVVRLKGGDPFVFGRGGEEMEHLLARGIPCRTIPGVTSAIAAAESCGIPVTHRGVSSGFVVHTATSGSDIQTSPTHIYLMGLERLDEVVSKLREEGCPAETPVAVVSSATMRDERCVVGTLADIVARVADAHLVSPAVTLVGPAVWLREKLRPLVGRRILVPTVGESSETVDWLRALGAEVDVVQVGRIEQVGGCRSEVGDWLVFTSRNGFLPFDAEFCEKIRRQGVRVAVIGRSTLRALEEKGLSADFVASESTGGCLCAELAKILTKGDVVVHPTAENAPDSLAKLAEVCDYRAVAVYRNEAVALPEKIDLSRYDAAVYTCASSVRRLLAASTGSTRSLAIGPTTRRALEELGVKDVEVAPSPDPVALAALALRIAFDGYNMI